MTSGVGCVVGCRDSSTWAEPRPQAQHCPSSHPPPCPGTCTLSPSSSLAAPPSRQPVPTPAPRPRAPPSRQPQAPSSPSPSRLAAEHAQCAREEGGRRAPRGPSGSLGAATCRLLSSDHCVRGSRGGGGSLERPPGSRASPRSALLRVPRGNRAGLGASPRPGPCHLGSMD